MVRQVNARCWGTQQVERTRTGSTSLDHTCRTQTVSLCQSGLRTLTDTSKWSMTIDHHQKQLEAENKKEVETDRYAAETDRMAKTGQFSRVGATGEAEAGSMDRPAGEHKAPMPQSSLEENVMESDWSFLLAEWGRYYEATNLSKDQAAAVRHLWAWSLKFTTTATMVGGTQPFWEAHLRGEDGKTY